MTYTLVYIDGDAEQARENFNDFALAKHMAQQAIETGIANRAEVRRLDGVLLFSRPRTMRRGRE